MFSFLDASHALAAYLFFPDASLEPGGVSIDTRTLTSGDLFVALKGRRQDGHAYLEEAFRKGASGAILERTVYQTQKERFLGRPELFRNLLGVWDSAKALGDLAAWFRTRHNVLAVGVTGSVGKTSTKEFLSYLLCQKHSVLTTEGNLNNHLGLPLTLLRLRLSHRFCVAEVGANHEGEIRDLARLLKPQAAVLTQISPVHLEGFGSLEGVMNAKLELFEALPSGAAAVLPAEDDALLGRAKRWDLNFIRVGRSPHAEVRISRVWTEGGWVHFEINRERCFAFPGIAPFLAQNAAMAVAMAWALGMSHEEIPRVWEGCRLPPGRFTERFVGKGIRVIDDGYNASPTSFEKALEAFQVLKTSGRKILVFADMLELGPEAERYHEELGRQIAEAQLHCVTAYGELAERAIDVLRHENSEIDAYHFKTSHEAAEFLGSRLQAGDVLLLKGSRGMKVEDVLRVLEQRVARAPEKD